MRVKPTTEKNQSTQILYPHTSPIFCEIDPLKAEKLEEKPLREKIQIG
jgi:hypothetical protein